MQKTFFVQHSARSDEAPDVFLPSASFTPRATRSFGSPRRNRLRSWAAGPAERPIRRPSGATLVQIKAVFFDFGRTLFDVRDPGELVARCALAMGLSVDPSAALRTWDQIAEAAIEPAELARERDISARAHRSNWVRLLSPLDRLGDGLAEAVYQAQMSLWWKCPGLNREQSVPNA